MKQVRPPMLVCEPVLTEVIYFLREDCLTFDPSAHWPRIRTLMSRYRQMDLADASVVVMTELHARSRVLTIDRTDFSVYRRNDRQLIDFISPGKSRAR